MSACGFSTGGGGCENFVPSGGDWQGSGSIGDRHESVPVDVEGKRRTLHAKSLVIDESIGLIGTHNFDPRPADLNTESGLIVTDAGFAARLADTIRATLEPQESWVVARRERSSRRRQRRRRRRFSTLPLFDLWLSLATPASSSSRLRAPVRACARFYDCYVSGGIPRRESAHAHAV